MSGAVNNMDELRGQMLRLKKEERQRERLARGMIHVREDLVCITEEFDALLKLNRLERLLLRVVEEPDALYNVIHVHGRAPSHHAGKLGDQVWHLAYSGTQDLRTVYPDYVFNPLITVGLRAIDRVSELFRTYSHTLHAPVGAIDVRRALDRFARFVSRVVRSVRFRNVVNGYNRNARERLRASCEYTRRLFEHNSRLLVLRVDLYYRPDSKLWADELDAKRGFAKFCRDLREGRIVPGLKGWICKREIGARRGIHFHVMIFLDGHRHRDAANLSRMVGEYWVSKCTGKERLGNYFNCYVRRSQYALNGLGLIHADDRDGLLGIREALRYLTKGTHQLKTGHKRNFFRGKMPESPVSKCGAPRARTDISAIEEILG